MPAWALVVAASIAAAAGVGAVVLASPVVAVLAGTASAVTALLALDGRLAATRAASALARPDPDAAGPGRDDVAEVFADDDPIRALLEAAPPPRGSGVLDENSVRSALRARLGASRRSLRPLAVVCIEAMETDRGRPTVPVAADEVAEVLRRTLRDGDVAAHAGAGAFLCILEDTGEDGGVWTAERVRRRLVETGRVRRFHAGVAAYPSHGVEAAELEVKAREALTAARDWATDRIEVAPGA